jgi:serine/threonine protein phosphatase 1
MERIFAIGDIHGCNEIFCKMLFDEIKIQKTDIIYCMGDYIDRGPDSKGVIDTILDLQKNNYRIRALRGNHEEMMMESDQHITHFLDWYKNGGNSTLESFGIDLYAQMDKKYRDFFERTQYYFTSGDYIFVHAGLNFSQQDIFEDREAMLWARDFDPQQPVLGNRTLIHGHTPKSLSYIKKQKGNCINIDGGCVYKERKNMGNLVAFSLPEKEFLVVENK